MIDRILIVGIIILSIINIIAVMLVIRNSKVRKKELMNKMISLLENRFENIGFFDCFSKEIIELYLNIYNNPSKWTLKNCTLEKINDETKIWTENDMVNRRLYYFSDDSEDYKNKAKQINDNLTYYDKLLLDKIVKAFKNNQEKMVTKFFIA